MKKLLTRLFLAFPVLLFATCKKVEKDVRNYYPDVRMVSAVAQPDGTVLVTGEVLSEGNKPLSYAGFCMDTIPLPAMLSNQQPAETMNGNQFSYTYRSLSGAKKYYFRFWATNENGYDLSDASLSVDKPSFSQDLIPCQPAYNRLRIEGHTVQDYYHITPLEQGALTWDCFASANNRILYFRFNKWPVNGVYRIFPYTSSYPDLVYVRLDGYELEEGGKVYVRELDEHTLEITICDGHAHPYGSSAISTRFQVKR